MKEIDDSDFQDLMNRIVRIEEILVLLESKLTVKDPLNLEKAIHKVMSMFGEFERKIERMTKEMIKADDCLKQFRGLVQLTKVKASQNDWYKDEIPLQSSIKKVKDKLQITTTQVDDEGSAITFMEH